MITFTCGCGQALKAQDEMAGRPMRCPACGRAVEARAATDVGEVTVVEVAPDPKAGPPTQPLAASAPSSGPPPLAIPACPSCGAALSPGAAVCTSCGLNLLTGRKIVTLRWDAQGAPESAPVEPLPATPASPWDWRDAAKLASGCAGALIVCAIVYWMWTARERECAAWKERGYIAEVPGLGKLVAAVLSPDATLPNVFVRQTDAYSSDGKTKTVYGYEVDYGPRSATTSKITLTFVPTGGGKQAPDPSSFAGCKVWVSSRDDSGFISADPGFCTIKGTEYNAVMVTFWHRGGGSSRIRFQAPGQGAITIPVPWAP